jgi:hypothetical protein
MRFFAALGRAALGLFRLLRWLLYAVLRLCGSWLAFGVVVLVAVGAGEHYPAQRLDAILSVFLLGGGAVFVCRRLAWRVRPAARPLVPLQPRQRNLTPAPVRVVVPRRGRARHRKALVHWAYIMEALPAPLRRLVDEGIAALQPSKKKPDGFSRL